MNKSVLLVLAVGVLSAMGYAQANLDKEVDAELNKMYSSGSQTQATTAKQVDAAQASQAPVNGQPIYILNQATPTATSQSTSAAAAVQKQPTTVIEASPLTESRAEALRKARQDAETSTEVKIVEKLEASRLEDEKRRAQALFGDKLSSEAQAAPAAAQPAVAPAQAPQIIYVTQQPQTTVAPVAAPAAQTEATDAGRVDIKSAVVANAVISNLKNKKYYMGSIGVPVVDANYVQGDYSFGFTYGNQYEGSYAIEGSFIYSRYEAADIYNSNGCMGCGPVRPNLFDVSQYTGAVAGKWYMLDGMIRPVLGGILQYSYRDFEWSEKNYPRPIGLGESYSHAVDAGGLVGVEIDFNTKMTMGVDARYYKNIMVRRNYSIQDYSNGGPYGNAVNGQYGYRTPIEQIDYYMISLTARVVF